MTVPRAREVAPLIWRTVQQWMDDKAMRLSASLAMYTVLSLSPLLVITMRVLTLSLAQEAADQQIRRQLDGLIGPQAAAAVNAMIVQSNRDNSGLVATAVSFVLLVVTASGVFVELQDALNTIWRVRSVPALSWGAWFRNRLVSAAMVFVIGFLLLVSQVLTTALTAIAEYLLGGASWASFVLDIIASVSLITLLFAMLFRLLPDVKIGWFDVVFGAALTALLFKLGQYVLALYFTFGATTSAYGAAGSFIALLLWVYYSCWIVFFGAEFTKVYARFRGRWIEPEDFAEKANGGDPKGNVAGAGA